MLSVIRNRCLAAALFAACALGVMPTVPAQAQEASTLQIATVSVADGAITISGRNFGAGTPAVTLGDSPLAVTRSSDTEISVAAPALEAGMYLLKVTRDSSPAGTASTVLLVQ